MAYGRVMMIGVGGAGKTSLRHALMNEPLPLLAFSTLLANALSVKYHFARAGGHYWMKMDEHDEVNELATLLQRVFEVKSNPQAPSSLASFVSQAEDASAVEQFLPSSFGLHASETEDSTSANDLVEELLKRIKRQLGDQSGSPGESEVLLHLWDSGGQVVFMNILPAFLTSRTLFMLVFDASKDLDQKLTVSTICRGEVVHSEPYHLSSIELLLQWMAVIHSHLTLRRPDGTVGAYPRVLLVGTRKDQLQYQKIPKIHHYLHSRYKDKYYSDILTPTALHIVDNTTAGQGANEDPAFKEIRQCVHEFTTKNLAVKTPLTWVLFRKVMQSICKDDNKPVVSYGEAAAIAKACYISPKAVPSVLNFYHELGVFLYYANVRSLQKWVVADPQWLVSEFAKLLCPHGMEDRGMERLWDLFRTKGILIDQLYKSVWSDTLMEPQAMVDLLVHFLLAAPVKTSDEHPYKCSKEYFVPCMLDAPTPNKADPDLHGTVYKAETLHLIFDTHYVPPGFFVRLVTSLVNNPNCKILFNLINRYKIVFAYGEVDKVQVNECTESIEIHLSRTLKGTHADSFPHICRELFRLLLASVREVKMWLPSVKVSTAFKCTHCKKNIRDILTFKKHVCHFVAFTATTSTTSSLICQKGVQYMPTKEQQYWLNPSTTKLVSTYYYIPHVIIAMNYNCVYSGCREQQMLVIQPNTFPLSQCKLLIT